MWPYIAMGVLVVIVVGSVIKLLIGLGEFDDE